MRYRLIVKPLAENDILESYHWYEQQSVGLGDDFLSELGSTLNLIESNPQQYQVRYKDVHMAKINRFPYCIHYTIEQNTVFIHAVLNTKRNPENWNRKS